MASSSSLPGASEYLRVETCTRVSIRVAARVGVRVAVRLMGFRVQGLGCQRRPFRLHDWLAIVR